VILEKRQSTKIDQQGRAALNFQITMTLMLFIGLFCLLLVPAALILLSEMVMEPGPLVATLTLLLPLPLIAIGVFCTYQGVINTIRSLSEKPIRYPLSIPFVK
jgi:uncharacterized Tic20 family protein